MYILLLDIQTVYDYFTSLFLKTFLIVVTIDSKQYTEYIRKEGNVLFNDALNTFYLRLYGIRHMVKDHTDSERGNPLPPHRLLFPISSKGFFYMHHPTERIAHTTAFVTPVVEHWLEREIAQWVHQEGTIPMTHHTMSEHSYHGATSRSHHGLCFTSREALVGTRNSSMCPP